MDGKDLGRVPYLFRFCLDLVSSRLDFCRSLVSGLRSGEERGLLSRTAAGNRA